MKKILTIFTFFVAVTLISSCQKDLPDSLKNIEINKGEKDPVPSPIPDNPSQQGDIPSENDNPMPEY